MMLVVKLYLMCKAIKRSIYLSNVENNICVNKKQFSPLPLAVGGGQDYPA